MAWQNTLSCLHLFAVSCAWTEVESPDVMRCRYGGMFVIGMAYRGTANNSMLQKLLHYAVSDVSDDVRRAAVLNLGFLLLGVPDQCPPIVSLLSESYNPHVRYGKSRLQPRLRGPCILVILWGTAQQALQCAHARFLHAKQPWVSCACCWGHNHISLSSLAVASFLMTVCILCYVARRMRRRGDVCRDEGRQ